MVKLKQTQFGKIFDFKYVEFETGGNRVQTYIWDAPTADPSGVHSLYKPLPVDGTCEYDRSIWEKI